MRKKHTPRPPGQVAAEQTDLTHSKAIESGAENLLTIEIRGNKIKKKHLHGFTAKVLSEAGGFFLSSFLRGLYQID